MTSKYGFTDGDLQYLKAQRLKYESEDERRRREFSYHFDRLCGILSGTGLGKRMAED